MMMNPRLHDNLNRCNIYACFCHVAKGCWTTVLVAIILMMLMMDSSPSSSSSSSSSSSPSIVLRAVAAEVEAAVIPNNSQQENFWEFADCTLKCQNGGECRFVNGSRDQLAKMAQAGHLIETCDCLEGFAGLACELPVDECILPDRICSKTGRFCDPVDFDFAAGAGTKDTGAGAGGGGGGDSNSVLEGFFTGFSGGNSVITTTTPETKTTVPDEPGREQEQEQEQWTCECSAADERSEFAGRMCRNPITQYCQRGPYDPHLPTIHFCTNGGRCESDFSPTSKSLFSTSTQPPSNNKDDVTGSTKCRCPKDFYGPHCEFFLTSEQDDGELSSSIQSVPPSIITTKKKTPGEKFLLAVFTLTVVALAAAVILKRRNNSGRIARRRRFSYTNNASSDNVCRFGRTRGREETFQRQNYCDVVEGGIAKSGNSIMYIPNIGASAFIPCPFDDGIILPRSTDSPAASETSRSLESERDETKKDSLSDRHYAHKEDFSFT